MGAVLNTVFGLFLSFLLVLTGQSMAVARGASGATDQMVICTGSGPETVYIDAEGNPTTAPHICPDCVLTFSDAAPHPVSEARVARLTDLGSVHPQRDVVRVGLTQTGFYSRAPPMSV